MNIDSLYEPAGFEPVADGRLVSRFMHLVWRSRTELQSQFDLQDADGRRRFCDWFESAALREYRISPRIPTKSGIPGQPSPLALKLMLFAQRMDRQCWWLPVRFRRKMGRTWHRLVNRLQTGADAVGGLSGIDTPQKGATLVGYANAVLGMGEYVRMTAAALEANTVPFGVYNFSIGVRSRESKGTYSGRLLGRNDYRANILHINADQTLTAHCHLGPHFFRDRYTIGYWNWELSDFPEAWVPMQDLLDEIWAPSRFTRDSLAKSIDKPLIYMPECVELPAFRRLERRAFGLPEDSCLFLYVFDFMSFIERKNPIAAVRAFKRAFPDRSERAGLVLKHMNVAPDHPAWIALQQEIDGDPRVVMIDKIFTRAEITALFDCCDCFLSLHRSEGFGRGPAEAMFLGRPVIATNYSGNTDFTKAETSFLVDYQLIPVENGQYVFGDGKVWADPDVDHAARHMRFIRDNASAACEVGLRGQAFIRKHFSARATGRQMRDRLVRLRLV